MHVGHMAQEAELLGSFVLPRVAVLVKNIKMDVSADKPGEVLNLALGEVLEVR